MTRLVSVWAELAVALRRPGHLERCLHRRVPVTGVFGLAGVDTKIVDMKITATRCLAYGATAVKVLDMANGSSLATAFGTQGPLQSLPGWEIPSRRNMGGKMTSRNAEDNVCKCNQTLDPFCPQFSRIWVKVFPKHLSKCALSHTL